MPNPTFFVDEPSITSRQVEVPDADWENGCNLVASNSIGIGIGVDDGAVQGTDALFTLLDQNGDPRTPQAGSQLGNTGFVDRAGSDPWPGSGGEPGIEGLSIQVGTPNNDGTITDPSDTHLVTLEQGWIGVIPP